MIRRQAVPPGPIRDGRCVTAPRRCGRRTVLLQCHTSGMWRNRHAAGIVNGRGRVGFQKRQRGFGRVVGRRECGGSYLPMSAGRRIGGPGGRAPTSRQREKGGRCHARPVATAACRSEGTSAPGHAGFESCSTLPDFANCSPSKSGLRTGRDMCQRVFALSFFARVRKGKAQRRVIST